MDNSQDAELKTFLARVTLTKGPSADALLELERSLLMLTKMYKDDPQDTAVSGTYAMAMYDFANVLNVPATRRRELYKQAESIAAQNAVAHPKVLSATLFQGKCELGLARLDLEAHRLQEMHEHARLAARFFSTVRNAYALQPEASALLAQATQLS